MDEKYQRQIQFNRNRRKETTIKVSRMCNLSFLVYIYKGYRELKEAWPWAIPTCGNGIRDF